MGRPERPLDPEAGPLQRFAFDLRQLRQAAGGPSYRQLSKRAHYSVTTLSEAAGGEVFPTLEVTLAYVEACGGDREAWESRWRDTSAAISAPHKTASAAEVPIAPQPSPLRKWAQRWRLYPRLPGRSQTITVAGLMVGAALAVILLLGIATAVSNNDSDPAAAAPGTPAVPGPGPVSGRAPAVIAEDAVCSEPVRIPLEKQSGPGNTHPDVWLKTCVVARQSGPRAALTVYSLRESVTMTTNWAVTLHHCLGNGITRVGYQVDEIGDAASNTIMTNPLPMPIGSNWQGNGRVLDIKVVDASGTVWTGGGREGVAAMSPCSSSPR